MATTHAVKRRVDPDACLQIRSAWRQPPVVLPVESVAVSFVPVPVLPVSRSVVPVPVVSGVVGGVVESGGVVVPGGVVVSGGVAPGVVVVSGVVEP
jgi:hypothetical protein